MYPRLRLRPRGTRDQGRARRRDVPFFRTEPRPCVVLPPAAERRRGFRRVHASGGTVHGLRPPADRAGRRLRGLLLEGGRGRDLHADRGVLAALALAVHLHGPLARDGPPLGPHAQAAHLRADGCHSGGPHHGFARGRWRGAQLGLPVHLDQGRRLHPLRPPAYRLHGRGGRVHELARSALPEVQPRRVFTAHVRHRRPEGPHGDDAGSPRRLPRLAPGQARQRRLRPVTARHLRRAHGRRLPLQQARIAHLLRPVDPPAGSHKLGLRQLAESGRGDLGDQGRPQGLRVLQAHVLGRHRQGLEARRQALLPRRPRQVAGDQGRDLRGDHGARAGARNARRSCSPTATIPWTPPT